MSLKGYTCDMIEIINYSTKSGKEPFADWFDMLDNNVKGIIRARIARIRLGNFGDCKPLQKGLGIWEFRIAYGPGYRIYFGKKGTQMIILLAAGDKGSQLRDIEKAKRYWQDYKGLLDE